MEAFVEAFQTLGYSICLDGSANENYDKIAIYGVTSPDGTVTPTHASFQLPAGIWTSKLGKLEDIAHNGVDNVNGPVYGRPFIFMHRPRP